MTLLHPLITFEDARRMAEKEAGEALSAFVDHASTPFLSTRFLEAEHCWMFFRNEAIVIPPTSALWDCAYAISKRGSRRKIVDFSDDPTKLDEYLLTMSAYFRDRGDREDAASVLYNPDAPGYSDDELLSLLPHITFNDARARAEQEARSHVGVYMQNASTPVLAERHLEAEHCWIFFRNETIVVSPAHSLTDEAYAVSKRGAYRTIGDFLTDPKRLEEHLQTMSDYFRGHGDVDHVKYGGPRMPYWMDIKNSL